MRGLDFDAAFHRHDGPYAAATARANKGPQAPMQAFDPNTLNHSAPPSSRPSGKGQLSARAQAAMAAMSSFDDPNSSTANLRRRNSDSSVRSITLGYPTHNGQGSAGGARKNAQLIEAYGVRDSEAWQDYGRSYTPQSGGGSFAASRESVGLEGQGEGEGVSREDRMARATSVWDIEATLKAGKPVGAAPPPPPMPVIPSEFSHSSFSSDGGAGPKRSKSLVSRFGRARKGTKGEADQPPSPASSRPTISGPTPVVPPPFNRAQTDAPLSRSQRGSPTSPGTDFAGGAGGGGGSYPYFGATAEAPVAEQGGRSPASQQGGGSGAVRFVGGPGLGSSRSEGEGGRERAGGQPMARKGSVLARLFGKKVSLRCGSPRFGRA